MPRDLTRQRESTFDPETLTPWQPPQSALQPSRIPRVRRVWPALLRLAALLLALALSVWCLML